MTSPFKFNTNNSDWSVKTFQFTEQNLKNFSRKINLNNDCVISAVQLSGLISKQEADKRRFMIQNRGNVGIFDLKGVINELDTESECRLEQFATTLEKVDSFCKWNLKVNEGMFADFYSGKEVRKDNNGNIIYQNNGQPAYNHFLHIFILAKAPDGAIYYVDPQANSLSVPLRSQQAMNSLRNAKAFRYISEKSYDDEMEDMT